MSQEMDILQYMKHKKTISPIIALQKFGCFRLAARIYDLRNKGYQIEAKKVGNGANTWAEYSLKDS